MWDTETLPTGVRALSGAPVDTADPARRPRRAPLIGDTVALHPVETAHADSLYELSHSDTAARTLWNYLPYGPYPDLASFKGRIAECIASGDPLYYSVFDQVSRAYAGMTSYLRIAEAHRVIEIGHIWFAPVLQNSRQSTEALFLMMRHAFDDLGYRRMEWKCNALNSDSRRAARRLGFIFEGIFYRSMIVKGHNRDTAWYSILDEEWPRLRDNFRRWLDPGNFDTDGRQKRSLSDLNQQPQEHDGPQRQP